MQRGSPGNGGLDEYLHGGRLTIDGITKISDGEFAVDVGGVLHLGFEFLLVTKPTWRPNVSFHGARARGGDARRTRIAEGVPTGGTLPPLGSLGGAAAEALEDRLVDRLAAALLRNV